MLRVKHGQFHRAGEEYGINPPPPPSKRQLFARVGASNSMELSEPPSKRQEIEDCKSNIAHSEEPKSAGNK